MTMWPPDKASLKRPAYRSLAQSLIDAVKSGAVAPGAKLPTHRALAHQLGLSVQTVSRAYDELARLGVISGEVGRGSFVRSGPPDVQMPWHRSASDTEIIDCSMLVPVTGALQAERMAQTLEDLSRDLPSSTIFSFRPRATLEPHCEIALDWLSLCGVETTRDQVLPCNGATSAMSTALMTVATPGDLIVTEEMSHHTLKSLTHALGLRLCGTAIDRQGIIPDALDELCASTSVKALFLHPNGLNATAAVMGAERRAALVEIARKHHLWIVENDAWGPVQPGRIPPLAQIAPERTLYFTGLTKCLLPGLRIAWLVSPPEFVTAARTRHLVANWMATPLMAEIASRWLTNGVAKELLQWQQGELQRRNALAKRALSGAGITTSPTGLHVWLPLSEPWREESFVAHALHNGVAVASGANFATSERRNLSGVRIALGAGSEERLEEGLAIIARLVRSQPEPVLLAI